MPTITFVRHAEGFHNSDHRARGNIAYSDPANRDAALTPIGHQQTQREMRNYIYEKYDAIYCSPLQRCRQTLLGIYPAARELPVIVDDRLMEPQGDHLCNWRADRAEIVATVPPCWDMLAVSETNPGGPPHTNESGYTFHSRIRAWTADMVTRHHPDARILVVTHYTWTQHWFDIHRDETVCLANCIGVTTVWPRKKLTPLTVTPNGSVSGDDDDDDAS